MKKSAPISLMNLEGDALDKYISLVKGCEIDRVCLYHPGGIHLSSALVRREAEKIRAAIDAFHNVGVEAFVWVEAFGHGRPLYSTVDEREELMAYTPIEGLDGRSTPYGLCPLDERFASDYLDGIRRLCELSPDGIMLDDDFRFCRGGTYFVGCFCPRHTEDYYARVGERVDKSRLASLIFTGGENKYRRAYREMLADSLLGFARRIRETIDSVNPSIRAGACSVRETLDYDGTDQEQIARTLAGGTAPFTRTSGAPYGGTDIIPSVEFTRLQLSALYDTGVETMTEGDTYPRPRYNTSYKVLQLYNYAIVADGHTDGRLDYLFDYNHRPDYETGYAERYKRDADVERAIAELFRDKSPTGVRIVTRSHKLVSWELPEELDCELVGRAPMWAEGPVSRYIAANTIPTAHTETGYPALILGENARGADRECLRYGAILDITAARILSEAGIDTGLDAILGDITPVGEEYLAAADTEPDVDSGAHKRISVRPEARVESVFLPERTPASYTYENSEGEKFLVLATDSYFGRMNRNYTSSYHRQAQLVEFITACGKPLPALCERNPNLYMLASEGADGSLAVLLINSHPDEVISPRVKLGREYSSVRMVGCEGELCGDELALADIMPFGFAAFELR